MNEVVIQLKSGTIINVDATAKKHMCKKDYIWNPYTWRCKNSKYLRSIIDDSVITCDDIIDAEAKSNDEEII